MSIAFFTVGTLFENLFVWCACLHHIATQPKRLHTFFILMFVVFHFKTFIRFKESFGVARPETSTIQSEMSKMNVKDDPIRTDGVHNKWSLYQFKPSWIYILLKCKLFEESICYFIKCIHSIPWCITRTHVQHWHLCLFSWGLSLHHSMIYICCVLSWRQWRVFDKMTYV